MFDPQLRVLKDRLLEPLVRPLTRVHPIAITLLAFAVGLGCAFSVLAGSFGLALGLWLLNRLLDGLDGLVARRFGKQSDLGGYLDLVLDFVVYLAVPAGLALWWSMGDARPSVTVWIALAALFASYYLNAASWLALSALLQKRSDAARSSSGPGSGKTSLVMPRGLVEGAETIVLYSLMLILPHATVELFWISAALVSASALARAVWFVWSSRKH